MAAKIEKDLRDKFDAFNEAAASGGLRQYCSAIAGEEAAGGLENIDYAARLIGRSLQGADDVRSTLAEAALSLPAGCWSHVVVAFDGAAARVRAREDLARLGFEVNGHGGAEDYLAELNMAEITAPPLTPLLEWLGRVEGASLLADGDRRLALPRPAPAWTGPPMGPREAMMQVMMGEGTLPGDLARTIRSAPPAVVAVLDTGVDSEHPALAPAVIGRKDFTLGQLGPIDKGGHGTHVAGIVAGQPFTGDENLSGVAPLAKLIDVQVLEDFEVTLSPYLYGIGYAIRRQVDVLNMSLFTDDMVADGKSIYSQAVQQACNMNILCCVSAGNFGQQGAKSITAPADAPDAIAVASVSHEGRWSRFSSRGPTRDPAYTGAKPTVAAPGERIVSACSSYYAEREEPLDPERRYVAFSGTSMASPMVAGLCALGVGYARGLGLGRVDSPMIREALLESARDARNDGADKVGRGVPNVPAFLDAVRRRAGKGAPGAYLGGPEAKQERESERDEPLVHALWGRSPVSGAASRQGAATDDPAREPREIARAFCAAEDAFIRGLRTNIEVFGPQLGRETLGERRLRLGQLAEDSDSRKIEDCAMLNRLDERLAEALPRNAEFSGVLTKRGKPAMHVLAKSFSAWGALARVGAQTTEILSHVSEFVQRRTEEAGGVPCFFALFLPEALPARPGAVSLEKGRGRVYLCWPEDVDSGMAWTRVRPADAGWYAWLCSTPMSMEERRQWCLQKLGEAEALRPFGGLMYESDFAREAGMAVGAAHGLLAAACEAETSAFAHLRTSEGRYYVKRVKAR